MNFSIQFFTFYTSKVGLLFFALSICFFSCNNDGAKHQEPVAVTKQQVTTAPADNTGSQFPQIHSDNIEVKTFEVNDSTGKAKGWGYDIYVDSKRMIHQPIIPAIAGNNPFKTKEGAERTGSLAAEKIKKTGSLPTISVKELDSLGVTKNN